MPFVKLGSPRRRRLVAGSVGLLLLVALTVPLAVLANLTDVSPGTQSPNPVAPGLTATYDVQVTNDDGQSRSVSITSISGLPVGASLASSECVRIPVGTATIQVTVATTAATPVGSYGITMTATRRSNSGTDCTGGVSDTLQGSAQLVVAKADQTIAFDPLADRTYGDADFAVSATASSGLPVSFSSTTASVCTVTGSTVSILAAGSCTIQADQAGNATYNAAPSESQSFDIAKADATIDVTGYSGVYDGAAHGATGTATGVLDEDLGADLDLGASFTDVPGGSADWTFTDSTGNYNDDAGSVAIDIAKADATIDVTGYSGVYDGAAHGATGTATGVLDEDLGADLDLGASFTDVPGGSADWTFTDSTGNYNDDAGSVAIDIAKADATIDVTGYSGVYDGAAHGATGTATGVLDEDLGADLDLGASFTDVPGGSADWTFTDSTGNYNDDAGSVAIDIAKADATIDVTGYSGVYDGAAHGATGTATGVLDEDLGADLDLGASFTDVPGGSADWTFTDSTGNYNDDAGSVAIDIGKASQTITFGTLADKALGAADFAVSATASSGLPVSFSSTTASVCTVSGSTVHLVAVGTCTIKASQAGNATYSAAPPVSRSFSVAKATQTITFGTLADKALGAADFAVSATASSGLPVSFSSTTASVCTVSGSTVHLVAVGTCTIKASQAGNATYSAAPPVSRSFSVGKASQTITFGTLADKALGAADFAVSATASSGLPVSFSSTTASVCTVSGSTVHLVAVGTCTIKASQAGNATYSAAPPVSRSFSVAKATQTITFGTLADKALGAADFAVSATASSGLPVSFSSTTASVCTVSGSTVHLVAVGTCTIKASQAGNATYSAAPPVSRSFSVGKATGTVTRIYGADRYATAAKLSAKTFAPGVPVVYVATGQNYPDALAAGPAAAADGGPVLLVRQGSIPAVVATELDRLDPGRIVVLGGPAVVSDAVKTALGAYTTGTVTRIYGADRYATAAKLSAKTFAPGVPVVYIATGRNYPDALAAGPAAGKLGGPILLVTAKAIPASVATELTRLKPAKIVLLGGPLIMSDAVKTALGAYTTGTVTRIYGADRYATAAKLSAKTFAPGVPVVYVATGQNYPDALAAGPAAAADGGPVLLVRQGSIPAVVATELDRLDPGRIVVLGGPAVVSDAVKTALGAYLAP